MKFLHQEFIEIQNKDSFSWSFGSKNALLLFQSTLLQCLLDHLDWEENILFSLNILKHVQPGFWLRQSTTSQLQWLVGNGWHSVTVVRHMRHKFWKDWKVPSKSQKSLGCSKVCGLHESLISCSLEPVYCIQARYQIWSQHGSQQQLPHVFPFQKCLAGRRHADPQRAHTMEAAHCFGAGMGSCKRQRTDRQTRMKDDESEWMPGECLLNTWQIRHLFQSRGIATWPVICKALHELCFGATTQWHLASMTCCSKTDRCYGVFAG